MDTPASSPREVLHGLRADLSQKIWAGQYALARLCLNDAEDEHLQKMLTALYAKRRAIDSELAHLRVSVPWINA